MTLKHDVGEIVDQAHDRLGALRHGAERHREEHREHDDLQDLVLRHRIRDRGRDQMGQEFLDREGRDRQAGRLGLVGQRAGEIGAGLQQVDHHEAEQQRDKGGGDEPAHGLGKDAPELGAASHMGDAADEGREHEWRDDHLDQAQEQHCDQVDVGCDLGTAVRKVVEDDRSHCDAKDHRKQDVLRKPVRHSLTPVSSRRRASVADLRSYATRFAPRGTLPICSRCGMPALGLEPFPFR
ncbi:hypothetical protein ACVWW1_005930 [Bradyrhizobium sp. JR3.5]